MTTSRIQELVGKTLKDWFPTNRIMENYYPRWLRGLEIDFYLPSLNLAIEVQGPQHRYWCPKLQPSIEDFHRQRKYDSIKRKKIRGRGIHLIETSSRLHLRKALEKRFPNRTFRKLPDWLFAEWRTYEKAVKKGRKHWVMIRVGKGGSLTPMNEASKTFLRLLNS